MQSTTTTRNDRTERACRGCGKPLVWEMITRTTTESGREILLDLAPEGAILAEPVVDYRGDSVELAPGGYYCSRVCLARKVGEQS
jgi:hypothetical protein